MTDPWDALSPERRETLEAGNRAYGTLKRGESIDHWYAVGLGCRELQQAALSSAGTNQTRGRAYRDAWVNLSDHVPHLRDIDKGARSHAIWLASNWTVVTAWLSSLPVNQRLNLNHPRSLHRQFDARHRPPSQPQKPSARVKLQDQIVHLTEQLDALCKMKTTGAIPTTMTIEDLADAIADQHGAKTVQRLIRALEKRVASDQPQNLIEDACKGRKGL
jgi:hypothetical protein